MATFAAYYETADGWLYTKFIEGVNTLGQAKRAFHREIGRFGGLKYVRFVEQLPALSAWDAALGKGRAPRTSYHSFIRQEA